jgi:hypothetical protein
MAARWRAHGFPLVADPTTFLPRRRDLSTAEDIHACDWARVPATTIGRSA